MDTVSDEVMKLMVHNDYLFSCLEKLPMKKRIEWVAEALERGLDALAGKIASIGLKPGIQTTLGATNDRFDTMPGPMIGRVFPLD